MAEKYFLGGMTPGGFFTPLKDIVEGSGYFTYILKGGAGTGKSTLMKKLAERFGRTERVTRFYCSSDPESLDAVILHSSKAVVIDGTSPHTMDPVFPGVCQRIVDLGRYWDVSLLSPERNNIVAACEKNRSFMTGAAYCSKALGSICSDTFCCTENAVNREALEALAGDIAGKLSNGQGRTGKEHIRQLSVMTRYGYMTMTETLENYPEIFLLEDSCFAASHMLIDMTAKRAVNAGFDVKLSPCLLFGQRVWEHLLIEDAGIALVSSNALTGLGTDGAERTDMSRFYDKEKMQPHEKRLEKDHSLIKELSAASSELMNSAKLVHDETESFYIRAMDFEKLDKVCERLTEEIMSQGKIM